MLKEKAGALAGQIWEALNGTEGLTQKQIKKATKLKADKDFFLGLHSKTDTKKHSSFVAHCVLYLQPYPPFATCGCPCSSGWQIVPMLKIIPRFELIMKPGTKEHIKIFYNAYTV